MTSRALAGAVAALLLLPVIVVVLFLGGAPAPAAEGEAPAAAASAAGPGPVAGGESAVANEALGARLAAARGWGGAQDTCLDELWTRESGWSATAINPTSGAYGISQALGHLAGEDQGASAAEIDLNRQGDNYPPADGDANPPPWGDSSAQAQITWGLGYIASAYGTPCGAWDHEEADGFY